ncbi:MAG: DUF2703 domain-containing protein [Nanoarchaeota archaeon]
MINIEFQFYNKTTCKRCNSTNKSIKLTLKELKNAIKSSKLKINLKEKKLPESKIHLSPSLIINGKDIEKIVNKSSKLQSNICSDCCQLAGHSVNCRKFVYKGKSYDYIPKEMIMEAIRISSKM